jgi:NADPH:quinone reductase-like Zn-dependent oxidoreductase
MLSEDQWHGALSRSSFSGVEIAVHDIEGPAQISTMMVSKAVNASQFSRRPHVKMIVAQDLEETRSDFASPLSLELEKHGLQVSRTSWESDTIDVEAAYIVLDNGKKPFLVKPTAERFQKIATIARDGRNIFWISAQDDEIAIENPEKSLITGLARSSHAENENLNLVTFDIQQTVLENWQTNLLQTVTKIFLDGMSTHSRSSMPREREYIYRNDQLLIPRLVPDKKVGRWISRAIGQPNIEFGIFGQSERPLKLMIGKPSMVDSPTFMDDELAQMSLDPSYVQIDVKACGVNKRDVMIALGQTKYSVTLGECAGIVTAVGSASGVFKIGDRVCAWGGEPYASCARVHKSNACRLPESISYTVGASIPVAFMTAYHTLVQLADLQKDETVLICGATGDIGQAAIMIAQYIGAVLFAGVSNNTERKIIIETFGVPSEHIVLNTAASFKRDVLKLTRGHGVNVTLNCSSVDFLEESWACIASLGTLIQIEEPAAYSQNGKRVVIPLDSNATFVSFDLVTLGQKRPRKTAELLDCVMSMFENNLLVPRHAVTTMPIADMRKAFGAVQAGKQIGKVVLEAEGSHMVQIIDPSRATVKLDGNATYVIAGGLGDLGQRLCRLMASRGATHIVVLSRSNLEANEKQRIEQELQSISAETSFYSMRCDIAEKSQVERTVSNILTNGLPPVKGVFQAAMVLRVSF